MQEQLPKGAKTPRHQDTKTPRHQDTKKKHNMPLDQYDFNFAIFASCLQDVGKGREQERKLWRELL